jgi:hypothetical protein
MEENKDEAWTGTTADKEIYACDVNEATQDPAVDSVVVGYVIWGVQGTINAILHDRYEISMVAQVTDGNLTVGLKNDGTTVGGDWLGAGNFRLKYLGEEATAEAIDAAAAYNGARATTLTETYVPALADEAGEFKTAPNFGAAQKDALANMASSKTVDQLVADGNLFAEIYATKAAYYQLCVFKDAVYNKWVNHPANDLDDDIFGIRDGLSEGSYADAATAEAALAALLEKYPDYLEFGDPSVTSETRNVEFEEGAAFEYEMYAESKNPYVTLKTFYDDLKENEVLLTFEYKSNLDIEGGLLYFGTPALDANRTIELPKLEKTSEWTSVTVDISKAVKEWGFGKTDHIIRWTITPNAKKEIELNARHFIINEKPGINGDLNGDGYVDPSDIQVILNDMAEELNNSANDLNGDGHVDPSDIQVILNIMAEAE